MTDTEIQICEHVWTKYKHTIKRHRTPTELKRTADPTRIPLSATFVLMGCEKCHEKYYVDYKVN